MRHRLWISFALAFVADPTLAAAADPAPGEWREGAKEVPAALENDPIAMITAKAMAHQLLHYYDLAAKEFGMAIARFPKRAEFRRQRCWAYVSAQTHYDLAVADCEKAFELTGSSRADSDFFLLRGEAYEGNRQYEAALADYDRALAMDDNNARLLLYRCETRAQWGQELNRGWNDCAGYINKNGPDARSHEAMALIRWRMKDYAAAAVEADRSIAIYARRAPALYLRGLAKRGAGDAAGGDADIAAATAIEPAIAGTYAAFGAAP